MYSLMYGIYLRVLYKQKVGSRFFIHIILMELNSLVASIICHWGSASVAAQGAILNMRPLWTQHHNFLYPGAEGKQQKETKSLPQGAFAAVSAVK